MMVIRSLNVFAMALALLLAAGCESKGPTPKEADPSGGPVPAVGSAETSGAHPAAGSEDPHAGMAPQPSASGAQAEIDADGMMDVGAIAFKVPGEWEVQRPKSSMRRAQLSARGAAGPAELIVFYFGPQGAGSAQENVDRWIGQFTKPDGSPVSDAKKSSSKVSGFDVTKVDVTGRFSGMGAAGQQQAPQTDQRLIAAILNTDGGPYYFKFLGPSATVAENGAIFDKLLASIVASP